MAARALIPEFPLMHILAGMAVGTLGVLGMKLNAVMTAAAGERLMVAQQWKQGKPMIKPNVVVPGVLVVTLLTIVT